MRTFTETESDLCFLCTSVGVSSSLSSSDWTLITSFRSLRQEPADVDLDTGSCLAATEDFLRLRIDFRWTGGSEAGCDD